jgi:hypothetical protein
VNSQILPVKTHPQQGYASATCRKAARSRTPLRRADASRSDTACGCPSTRSVHPVECARS